MIKVLELFSGIRACSKALERLGIDYEIVDSVEIDKYAVNSQNAIYGTNFIPQDITKWDKDIECDLIMHGSPCQDFSIAGKQAGADEGTGTRSSLLYETLRIVDKLKPTYVIWENVKNVLSAKHRHNFDKYLDRMAEMGYTNYYQVLNAKDYGIPQNRERVFTISILGEHTPYIFPQKQELKLKLKDMLENEVDVKYYLNKKWHFSTEIDEKHDTNEIAQIDDIVYKAIRTITDPEKICRCLDTMGGGQREPKVITEFVMPEEDRPLGNYLPRERVLSTDGISRAVTTSESQMPYINEKIKVEEPVHNFRIRKLTPLECWRLMGFDDTDFYKAEKVCSNSQLYKQAGNSIVVNVLEKILLNIFCKGE